MTKEILIILDSEKYRPQENRIRDSIAGICNPAFFYTDYENRLIKMLHGIKGAGNILSHIAYWAVSLKDAVRIYAAHKQPHKLFVNPIVGFFYCLLLSSFHGSDKVTVAGFLFEDKSSTLYLRLRKRIVDFAYGSAAQLVVYSHIEQKKYGALFPSLADKIKFVKYGRDFDIFKENEYASDSPYIASGGGSNRDFDTLVAAMARLEDESYPASAAIATRPGNLAADGVPANLKVLYDIRMETFGSFLANSQFVILPLKDNDVSAGHMSLMESMSLGKVIIITDIPSVRDYVNESHVFFYPPGDSQALAGMIKYVLKNLDGQVAQDRADAARRLYESEYGFSSFLKRLVVDTL